MMNIFQGRHRAGFAAAIGLAVLGLGSPSLVRADAPATVGIDNFSFVPDNLTVKVGTTVTWENQDDIPHSIVLADKSFRSKPLDTGDKATYTFGKVGTVTYFCGLHPHMQGSVTVVP